MVHMPIEIRASKSDLLKLAITEDDINRTCGDYMLYQATVGGKTTKKKTKKKNGKKE